MPVIVSLLPLPGQHSKSRIAASELALYGLVESLAQRIGGGTFAPQELVVGFIYLVGKLLRRIEGWMGGFRAGYYGDGGVLSKRSERSRRRCRRRIQFDQKI